MGNQLPVGTVTFLFTDIVGSTPLWESQPNLMAQALEIHHRALRIAIETHGGQIVLSAETKELVDRPPARPLPPAYTTSPIASLAG